MREYLVCFLVAAAVTYLLTPPVRRLAIKAKAMAEVRDRDIHATPTPRWGGLAMYGGFLAGLLIASKLPGMAVVFALAWLKGLVVILEFMELRHAPALWRRALIGALTLVVLLILLAYGLSLR